MNFFATCVDNFFEDPDKIRNFALSLDFSEDGTYPGYRTKHLHEIDINLYELISKKILYSIYNFENEVKSYHISMSFQKISPYSEDIIDEINCGWYHVDDDSLASGVIYLNQNSYPFAGTSIALPHSSYDDSKCDFQYFLKNIFYSNLYTDPNFDRKEYRLIKMRHSLNFEKTIEFKNNYNRMILYDGHYYHRESSFWANDHEPRLTLVFFIKKLEVDNFPVQRKNTIKGI